MCVLCLLLVVVFQSRLFIFLVGFFGILLLWVRILIVMPSFEDLSFMPNPRIRLSRFDAKCPSHRLSFPPASFCAPRNHVLKLGLSGGGGEDHDHDEDSRFRLNGVLRRARLRGAARPR